VWTYVEFDTRTWIRGLNLTPESKPVGFWVGFGCPSNFINEFLLRVFQVSFRFFWLSFGFRGFSGFVRVSGFFGFQVHTRVKNETHTKIRFCADQIWVTGTKIHLNPHLSGAKSTGYLKPEPKLPSLCQRCVQALLLDKARPTHKEAKSLTFSFNY
jgi:hypothetical protein